MSAIVDVLKKIAPDAECYSYGDKSHFDKLWKLDEKVSPVLVNPNQKTTIVIVWDEIPPRTKDVVATNKYLTPIDWAVAFSLALHDKAIASKKEDAKPVYPDLRILILDLKSQSSNADSVRLVNLSKDRSMMSMPWIRLFRPVEAETLIQNITNNAKGDTEVPSMGKHVKGQALDFSVLKNLWAAFLTKPSTPGDHHAIANLIGPLLLMDVNSSIQDSHVKALLSLLKVLDLIPNIKKLDVDTLETEKGNKDKYEEIPVFSLLKANSPWIIWGESEWKQKITKILTQPSDKLELILIDDQYHQGWGDVLCKAVGAKYEDKDSSECLQEIGRNDEQQIIVKAADSVEWLEKRLEELIKDKACIDKRFEFRIDSKNENSSEILFLDLRLFAGKRSKEVEFIKALCGIAAKFVDNNDSQELCWKDIEAVKHLPWQGFSSTEIERVRAWCNSANKNEHGEDNRFIEALTFLPRILSLIDLSLPIVIFSSTGRRDIADKLKYYGNIITDFDKPKFTVDMPEEIAWLTQRKFTKAFGKALGCLAVRKRIQKLSQKKDIDVPTQQENPASDKFASLYLDESGDGSDSRFLVLGGIMAVANSMEELKTFDTVLLKEHNWTKTGGFLKECNSLNDYKLKGDSILRRAVDNNVQLYGIVLSQSSCHGLSAKDMLLDDNVLDNLHKNMLRSLIEVVISYVAPNIVGDNLLHLSITVDVRSIPLKEMKKQDIDIEGKLLERFGMRAKDLSKGGRFQEAKNLIGRYPFPDIYIKEGDEFKKKKMTELLNSVLVSAEPRERGKSYSMLDEKDVYPIVASVLEEYRYSNLRIAIETAKGVITPDPGTAAAGNVSQLLHFCDWLPRMVLYSHTKIEAWLNLPWVQKLLSQGYIGRYDSSLEELLRIRRLLMEGSDPSAVEALLNLSLEKQSSKFPDTLNRLLMADIVAMLGTLHGSAFVNAFENAGSVESDKQNTKEQLFTVIDIDLKEGIVNLRNNSNGKEKISVDIDPWKAFIPSQCPPLIGDIVFVIKKRGYSGSYRYIVDKVIEAKVQSCRFGAEGLRGKITHKLSNGDFLIKGPSELGDQVLIYCTRKKDIAKDDAVIFTLAKGAVNDNASRRPWNLIAKNVRLVC